MLAAIVLVGLGWFVSQAVGVADALSENTQHSVARIDGPSGTLYLHRTSWGLGGGHEVAWVSLDPRDSPTVWPDSSRDLLIRDVGVGVLYQTSGNTLRLMHDVIEPPGGFGSPLVVEAVSVRASDVNRILSDPDSAGVAILH